MSWLFQPLLPGAAHQLSDPGGVSISEAATAASAQDAVLMYGVSCAEFSGGMQYGKAFKAYSTTTPGIYGLDLANETGFQTAVAASAHMVFGTLDSTENGYFGGGYTTSYVTTISRIAYSTYTVGATSASLAEARVVAGSVTKSRDTKGFWLGGENATSSTSEIDSLVYSTETLANTSATLPTAIRANASGESATYGYSFGGYNTSGIEVTAIQRINFSTEATSNSAATLNAAEAGSVATQSSSTIYVGGGYVSGAAIIKFITSSETDSTLGATIYSTSNQGGAETPLSGYFMGSSHATYGSGHGVDRIVFGTETASQIAVNLTGTTSGAYEGGAVYSPDVQAAGARDESYSPNTTPRAFFCGHNGSTAVRTIAFADDSAAISSYSLPVAVKSAATLSAESYGFLLGSGYQGSYADGDDIYSLNFGSEQWATESSTLSVLRHSYGCPTTTFGYVAGGRNDSSTLLSSCEKFTFSTKVVSSVTATLAAAKDAAPGIPSSTKAYYFAGDNFTTTIDGFLFSNDSAITVSATWGKYGGTIGTDGSTAFLHSGRDTGDNAFYSYATQWSFASETSGSNASSYGHWRAASAGDSARLYTAGGYEPGVTLTTRIDKLTYGTLTSALLGTALGTANSTTSGLGYGNAAPPAQTASKTEAATASATQNSAYGDDSGRGYIAGVQSAATVRRFSYDTDTMSILATTVSNAYVMAGTQSSDNGYAASDRLSGNSGTVDKLLFSAETRSNPSALIYRDTTRAAVASSTKGFWLGGGTNGTSCTALTFSNDTASSVTDSLDSARTYQSAGYQSGTKGYVAGGSYGGTPMSSIEGITFSGEAVATIAATLASAKSDVGAVQSSTVGYAIGGNTGSTVTDVDGFIFSTDATTNPASVLSAARTGLSGLSSASHGYLFGGGANTKFTFIYSTEAFGGDVSMATDYAYYYAATMNKSIPTSSVQSADITDSATATHSDTAAVLMSSAITESVTSTDSRSTLLVAVGSLTETAAASAAHNGVYTTSSAHTASASATDTPTGAATMPAAINEALTATASFDGGKLSGASHDAVATATSSEVGAFGFFVDYTGSVSALDTPSASNSVPSSAIEPATSGATASVLVQFVSALVETTPATDAPNTSLVAVVSATEAATATAEHDAAQLFFYAVSVTESASASEAATAGAVYPVASTQPATASSSHDATMTLVGQFSAGASASEVSSAIAGFVASITETTAADTSTIADTGGGGIAVESAAATDTPTAGASMPATGSASATAVDSASANGIMPATITESTTASAAQDGYKLFVVSDAATVTAIASQSASLLADAAISEAANGVSGQSAVAVLSVFGDATGDATDFSSALGTFVVTCEAGALATESQSAGSTLTATILEAAIALAEQFGLKLGDERIYRVFAYVLTGTPSVFVATKETHVTATSETLAVAVGTEASEAVARTSVKSITVAK